MRYPFAEYEKDAITSKTGKKFTDITLEEVMKGHIAPDDIKISKDMLIAQGQVARGSGQRSHGEKFRARRRAGGRAGWT